MSSIGIDLGIKLACQPHSLATASLRIVEVDDAEAFVIAPHAELGAVALHLMRGDGGDLTTSAASIGAPFGGWRIRGFRVLADPQADPTTAAVLFDGIGAQQYAMQMGEGVALFGGIYHGGLQDFVESDIDWADPAYRSAFVLDHETAITWSGGQLALVRERVELRPDGTIATICSSPIWT